GFEGAFVITTQGDIPVGKLVQKQPGAGEGGSSGTPSGGGQPKAAAAVAAHSSTQGAGSTKSNGSTRWDSCSLHKDSYPRIDCAQCRLSEVEYQQKKAQETRC